jgi:hypothetical protein
MATTPLYKSLKNNGTTFYAFPGAAEDISASYQNNNYRMYFSKYVLLNLPKQNINPGTQSLPTYFDFDSSFITSANSTPATSFNEQIVESLRNYVANHEVVLRESRLNNKKYFYNTNALETTTEKIFWKWCRKLNLIDFEPAIPDDEYFSRLVEFESRNINDDTYFPEYLWKEREVIDWDAVAFYQTNDPEYSGVLSSLEIEFSGKTNFQVGDLVNIYNVTNASIYNSVDPNNTQTLLGSQTIDGINCNVLKVIVGPNGVGQKIIVNINTSLGYTLDDTAQVRLVYSRLVQYVGEINGVSNINDANRSYTEIYAHIPDHTGQTPDILFRTMLDDNYRPNLTYPIIPSQFQPEIMGAEFFNSPIVSNPQNYPGSYFGQFDTFDFTYENSPGDVLRRTGDYYGVTGDINNPVINGSTIDGVCIDFNISHYVKMNIPGRYVTNFEQFNALQINNEPPKSFEFNAILWYYTVEDLSTQTSKNNLYGITFLDNPNNNVVESEIGLRFPPFKKLVADGTQDGSSYAFSLTLNFNIINENVVEPYNPESINSLFSMNLFNEAMAKLSSTNESFLNVISEQTRISQDMTALRGLIYTQTDFNVINSKIKQLEDLLRLYSTLQLVPSDTIRVDTVPGTPPFLTLNNIDTKYHTIENYNTSDMYSQTGAIPVSVSVPENKNLLINIVNNDEVELNLPNNEKLTMVLSKDLSFKQSIEIYITGNEFASQNKKLDIFILTNTGGLQTDSTEALLIGNIDLPVFFNTNTQLSNSAYFWEKCSLDIDFNQPMILQQNSKLDIPISGNSMIKSNAIKPGDCFYLNNLFVGTSSIYDFSGQYIVDSEAGMTSSYITLDMSTNNNFVAYGSSQSIPFEIHGTSSTLLSNFPYFSFNKGKKITITRITQGNFGQSLEQLTDRYQIQIDDIL